VKNAPRPQSATSLPQAPRDDADSRFVKYALTMGIRTVCLLALVLVTPYGWYSWLFAVGAIFLPYVAVVIANVGQDVRRPAAENPERTLSAPAPAAPAPEPGPSVIRIAETPRIEPPADPRP
jgi:hypothetical protein